MQGLECLSNNFNNKSLLPGTSNPKPICVCSVKCSLYFTITLRILSYMTGGLKLKVQQTIVHKTCIWEQMKWSCNQGGLKRKGCKIEGPLYVNEVDLWLHGKK